MLPLSLVDVVLLHDSVTAGHMGLGHQQDWSSYDHLFGKGRNFYSKSIQQMCELFTQQCQLVERFNRAFNEMARENPLSQSVTFGTDSVMEANNTRFTK